VLNWSADCDNPRGGWMEVVCLASLLQEMAVQRAEAMSFVRTRSIFSP